MALELLLLPQLHLRVGELRGQVQQQALGGRGILPVQVLLPRGPALAGVGTGRRPPVVEVQLREAAPEPAPLLRQRRRRGHGPVGTGGPRQAHPPPHLPDDEGGWPEEEGGVLGVDLEVEDHAVQRRPLVQRKVLSDALAEVREPLLEVRGAVHLDAQVRVALVGHAAVVQREALVREAVDVLAVVQERDVRRPDDLSNTGTRAVLQRYWTRKQNAVRPDGGLSAGTKEGMYEGASEGRQKADMYVYACICVYRVYVSWKRSVCKHCAYMQTLCILCRSCA